MAMFIWQSSIDSSAAFTRGSQHRIRVYLGPDGRRFTPEGSRERRRGALSVGDWSNQVAWKRRSDSQPTKVSVAISWESDILRINLLLSLVPSWLNVLMKLYLVRNTMHGTNAKLTGLNVHHVQLFITLFVVFRHTRDSCNFHLLPVNLACASVRATFCSTLIVSLPQEPKSNVGGEGGWWTHIAVGGWCHFSDTPSYNRPRTYLIVRWKWSSIRAYSISLRLFFKLSHCLISYIDWII